jgi:hypothetical protein
MIRKIIVGPDSKDGMAYFVGMKVAGGEVVAIEHDEKMLLVHSVNSYTVYIQKPEGTMPWKTIASMPVMIEYDCNF